MSIIGLDQDIVKKMEGSGKTARYIKVYSLLSGKNKERIVKIVKVVKEKAGIPD